MNDRNKYMVEQSDVVIAVWNGKPSGTGNTVKMAKLSGKKIRVVNPYNPAQKKPIYKLYRFRLKQNQIKRLKVRIYLKIELKSNKQFYI